VASRNASARVEGQQSLSLQVRHPSFTLSVEAHCGLEAPRMMGFAFARERAESVKAVLVRGGVDADRVLVKSWSQTRPLVWAFGPGAGDANRRVELYVRCEDPCTELGRPARYSRNRRGSFLDEATSFGLSSTRVEESRR